MPDYSNIDFDVLDPKNGTTPNPQSSNYFPTGTNNNGKGIDFGSVLSDNVSYSGQALGQNLPNPNGARLDTYLNPAQYSATIVDNSWNEFMKSFTDTQVSAVLGKMNVDGGKFGQGAIFGMQQGSEAIIDSYPDQVNKLNDLLKSGKINSDQFAQQKQILDKTLQEARINYDKLNKIYQEKKAESDQYASKINPLYEMKVQNVMSGGDDSSWLDNLIYGTPQGFGSMAGLMAPQMAVALGSKALSAGISALLTSATAEAALPTGITQIAAAGTTALIGLTALAYSRANETYSELGGTIQDARQQLAEQYMKEHGLQNPSQIPDEAMRQIRIKSRKGLNTQFNENMALLLLDIPEVFMTPMSTAGEVFGIGSKLGKISKGIEGLQNAWESARDYNRYSKLVFGAARQRFRMQMESFEEGLQQAAQYRATDAALGTGDYTHSGFLNSLMNDSYNTVSSLDYTLLPGITPALRGTGKYKDDKDFQTATSQGALLAGISGGGLGAISLATDFKAYARDKSDLVKSGLWQDPSDKFRRVSTDALARRFSKGDDAVTRYIHAIKAVANKTDENGIPYYTDAEADMAISQIKNAYKDYKDISERIERMPKRGFLRVFPSKEQKSMRDMVLSNYLNLNDSLRAKQNELGTNIQDNTKELQSSTNNNPEVAIYHKLMARKIAIEGMLNQRNTINKSTGQVDQTDNPVVTNKSLNEELQKVNASIDEEVKNLQTLQIDPNKLTLPSVGLVSNENDNIVINGHIDLYNNRLKDLHNIRSEKDLLNYYNKNKSIQQDLDAAVENAKKIQQDKETPPQPTTSTNKSSQISEDDDLLTQIETERINQLNDPSNKGKEQDIQDAFDAKVIQWVRDNKIDPNDAKAILGPRWKDSYNDELGLPKTDPNFTITQDPNVDQTLKSILNYPEKLAVPSLKVWLQNPAQGLMDENGNIIGTTDEIKSKILGKLNQTALTKQQNELIDKVLSQSKEPYQVFDDEGNPVPVNPVNDPIDNKSDTKDEELPAKQGEENNIAGDNSTLGKNFEEKYEGKKLISGLSVATKMAKENFKNTLTLGFIKHFWQQILNTNIPSKPKYNTLTIRYILDKESNLDNLPDLDKLKLGTGSTLTQDDRTLDTIKLGMYMTVNSQEQLVGYVHRLDSIEKLVTEENIESESSNIRNYRLSLIKQLKENPSKSFKTKITSVGTGSLTYSSEFKPISAAINGDTRPTLAYVGKDGYIMTLDESKPLMLDYRNMRSGSVVLLIPNEVNGQTVYFPSYVKKNKLGDVDSTGKKIVSRAIVNSLAQNIEKWLKGNNTLDIKALIGNYVFTTTDLEKTSVLGEYGVIMPKEKIQGSTVVWINGNYYRINDKQELEYSSSKNDDFKVKPGNLMDNLVAIVEELRGNLDRNKAQSKTLGRDYMNELINSGMFSTNIIQNDVLLQQSNNEFKGVLDPGQQYQYFTQRTIQFEPVDDITRSTKEVDKNVEEAKENEFKESDVSSNASESTQFLEQQRSDIEKRRQEKRGESLEQIGIARVGYDGKQRKDWLNARDANLKTILENVLSLLKTNPNTRLGALTTQRANAIRAEFNLYGINVDDRTLLLDVVEDLKKINAKYDDEIKDLKNSFQTTESQQGSNDSGLSQDETDALNIWDNDLSINSDKLENNNQTTENVENSTEIIC